MEAQHMFWHAFFASFPLWKRFLFWYDNEKKSLTDRKSDSWDIRRLFHLFIARIRILFFIYEILSAFFHL